MRLNLNLSNKACIGKHFAVCSDIFDSYIGSDGKVQYMPGESLEIRGYDDENHTVRLWNDCTETGSEEFEISFQQYKRDFGIWQIPYELLKKVG